MELMKNYSDLLTEIECIKLQIKLTKNEYEYWSGIKMNDPDKDGTPLLTKKHHKTSTQLNQIEKKRKALNKLYDRLEYHEQYKERMDNLMKQFNGLEYKIAYKRYVEYKTLREIADELDYSLSHIEKISGRMKQKAIAK